MIFRLILATLATYRLSQLVAWDNGPGYIFHKLRSWAKARSDGILEAHLVNDKPYNENSIWFNIDEAINCVYCLGMWFAMFTAILVKFPTKVGDFFLLIFGISGLQAFMQGITKER